MRSRGLDQWLPTYLSQKQSKLPAGDVHVLLCIADHYEPGNGGVSAEVARRRVRDWEIDYPRVLGTFADSDGRPPRHTFFYPMEQYVEEDLDALARLCRAGFGEVEIHLHHNGDTSANLRQCLAEYTQLLSERHDLLARERSSGAVRYGFIHGDWALHNALHLNPNPEGNCCGVDDELQILQGTGCYADFTLPAAPSAAQTRKINSIYRPSGNPHRPRSHDDGVDVGSGEPSPGTLMLIQGPLVLSAKRRKWGVVPKIENACVQANQALDINRLEDWMRAGVRVPSRPDWYFVKLHTHGGPEENARMLMGEPGAKFHRQLAERAASDPRFHYHYVTAREMYNLARAAEEGWLGGVSEARDYELAWVGAEAAASG